MDNVVKSTRSGTVSHVNMNCFVNLFAKLIMLLNILLYGTALLQEGSCVNVSNTTNTTNNEAANNKQSNNNIRRK